MPRKARSGVKLFFRILLVLGAPFIAYFTTALGSRFTVAALGSGRYEATPATVVGILNVLPLTLIFILVSGNIAINRYVPPISSGRNLNQNSLACIIWYVGTLADYVLACDGSRGL